MKQFLKYLTLFCIPVLAVLIIVEICDRKLPNTYRYKYEWMQRNAAEVETLILGNSHAFYGIQPKYMTGKAFNLANPAQLLDQDLFLLKYWSDQYAKLKTVILPISYFTLFSQGLEFEGGAYRCRYYSMYMDCDLYPTYSFTYNFEIAEPKSAILKMKKFILGESGVDWFCDEYGNEAFNVGKDVAWNQDAEEVVYSAETWDYTPKNCRLLEEILQFCKDRNVNIVLITTPCWHTYRSALKDSQLTEMYRIIHELQRKYGFPYFNYLQDERFTLDDFYNAGHLSDSGEKKFTRILDEDIRSIEKH